MQFYRAFGIYKRVMCETYPQRRAEELDLYEADIGDIYDHPQRRAELDLYEAIGDIYDH